MGVDEKAISIIYAIINFFILFILFSNSTIAQENKQNFSCVESKIFKIFEDMNTVYENNLHNNYGNRGRLNSGNSIDRTNNILTP